MLFRAVTWASWISTVPGPVLWELTCTGLSGPSISQQMPFVTVPGLTLMCLVCRDKVPWGKVCKAGPLLQREDVGTLGYSQLILESTHQRKIVLLPWTGQGSQWRWSPSPVPGREDIPAASYLCSASSFFALSKIYIWSLWTTRSLKGSWIFGDRYLSGEKTQVMCPSLYPVCMPPSEQ